MPSATQKLRLARTTRNGLPQAVTALTLVQLVSKKDGCSQLSEQLAKPSSSQPADTNPNIFIGK